MVIVVLKIYLRYPVLTTGYQFEFNQDPVTEKKYEILEPT
jgi:hypothetical protein